MTAPHAIRSALRRYTGRAHVLLAGRAAGAIEAALRVWDVRGKPVVLPANTCYAVLWAVMRAGGVPVLADVVQTVYGMRWRPGALDAVVPRPAVLIHAHMFGIPFCVSESLAWAKTHGVLVLEDAAQAFGAVAVGQGSTRPAGAWGDASVFSFGPEKTIDHGTGGALLTDSEDFARECHRAIALQRPHSPAYAAEARAWDDVYWALHQHEQAQPGLAALYRPLYAAFNTLIAVKSTPDLWRSFPLASIPADAHDDTFALWRMRAEAALDYDAVVCAPGRDAVGEAATRDDAPHAGFSTLARPPAPPVRAVLWRYPLLVHGGARDAVLAYLWACGFHECTRWYPTLQPMARALLPDVPFPETPGAQALADAIINLPLYTDAPERRRALCQALHEATAFAS